MLRGDHFLNGFRNEDIAGLLFPKETADKNERRRRGAKVSRRLRLPRAHRLIRKAPRARKYHVTELGLLLMGAAISIKDDRLPRLIERTKALAVA